MKKLYALTIVVVLLALLVAPVEAGRKFPPREQYLPGQFSWFGTYGMQGYPTLPDGYVYMAAMDYPYIDARYYTTDGDAFVAPSVTLTRISGTCFRLPDVPMRFFGMLQVDGNFYLPLFDTQGEVGVFDVTVLGSRFAIKIETIAPLGCNVLLEAVG